MQDEIGNESIHRKSDELLNSNSSYKDCVHDSDGTTYRTNKLVFGSKSVELETQENENNAGRQVNRILLTGHTSTLFEPDNNSFFSTNSFTKVSTAISGPGN